MSGRRYTLVEQRAQAAGTPDAAPPALELSRRRALQGLALGAAGALAACSRPREEIVPAVERPVGEIPGVPRRYATALTLGGYARGVLAISYDGRPIKIEGNPRHPYSLGSTDVFAEADVLGLYDPARRKVVDTALAPSAWDAFEAALRPRIMRAKAQGGRGLALVTGRVVSPTELRLIAALKAAYPQMSWRRYEPVHDDAERSGARLAFGRPLTVMPRLDRARVIFCLGADPLGPGPEQIANGRAFVAGRQPGSERFSRLYSAEGGWTLTGMNADHRLAIDPRLAGDLLLAVAAALGGPTATVSLPPVAQRFAQAVAADLAAHPGESLILVGREQPPQAHALAHWLNARLKAPVSAFAPIDPHPEDHGESLRGLASDLHHGRLETLVVLGCNPVFDAPAELGMAEAIRRAAFSVHAGLQDDETSAHCDWRLPLTHPLESWGDARAPDGTASLVQPLIRPLYAGRTGAEVLAILGGAVAPSAHDLVRATWAERAGRDLDAFWRAALSEGIVGGTAAPTVDLPSPALPALTPAPQPRGLALTLSPDPTLYDGRYAGNAWLQECPKPLTHETWGASVAISPEDAKAFNLSSGDKVRLTRAARSVEAPIRVTPGQAQGVLSAHLGGGRSEAGPIGSGVGWSFAALADPASPWVAPVTLERAGGRIEPPAFQSTPRLQGEARELSPVATISELSDLKRRPPFDAPERPPSLLPEGGEATPAWAMVIDAAACIGCNACVVACQAENNIPVVGPEEVARGRDMHWLRIDAYDLGESAEPRPAFQPVPCMHCEHAPCEPVCPVEASVHDHEGLNDQVYNRCIGTRFCESNCPYKVRRFNFEGYADGQPYADMGAESLKAQRNPEVTVRARGVMEKCTYCVQRISAARRLAERENRRIGPTEVVTACAAACPTQAIRFGDLTRPDSPVAGLREEPRHYALLGELGTRPRTTYLARLRNPNPALDGGEA